MIIYGGVVLLDHLDLADHFLFLDLSQFLIEQLDFRHVAHIAHSLNFKEDLPEIVSWLQNPFRFIKLLLKLPLLVRSLLLHHQNLVALRLLDGLQHFFHADHYFAFLLELVNGKAGSHVHS